MPSTPGPSGRAARPAARRRADPRAGRRARGRLRRRRCGAGSRRGSSRRRGAGRPPRPARCGSSRGCASAGTRSSRSARPARAGSWRSALDECSRLRGPLHARAGRARAGLDAGADRADLHAPGAERAVAGGDLRGGPGDAALRRGDARRRHARGGLPAARCASTGRRIAQIADAEVRLFHLYIHEPLMREGVPGVRDRRGDGGPRARAAAVRRAAHELPARALPRALRRAGRDRPHGGRPRRRDAARRGGCGWRSRSPTSPATRA